jgi:hypothetical protein
LIRENLPPNAPAYDSAGNPQRRTYYPLGTVGVYNLGKTGILGFVASDANPVAYNPMPAGTVVSATATSGLSVTVAGGSPIPSTTSPSGVAVNYDFADDTAAGTMTLTFRSPGGLATSVSQFLQKTPRDGATTIPCP